MGDDAAETAIFQPKFDSSGLVTAIVVENGQVLMLAHMNGEAIRLTQQTGLAHFWSRSRQRIWKKGETSGETLRVQSIMVDCDQDALLLEVRMEGRGAACHTGRRSCFYRRVEGGQLVSIDNTRLFDPAEAQPLPSPL